MTQTSAGSSHWCFTWNNPTLNSDQFRSVIVDSWKCNYAIFQPEMSATGTPHFQGYVEWTAKARKRLTALRKLLATAHWEQRLGTRDQARTYCTPDGLHDGVRKGDIPGAVTGAYVEIGTWSPAAQGKRSDLMAAVDTLKSSGWQAMVEEHPTSFIKYSNGLEKFAMEIGVERTSPPTVIILYGPTGCGKSRYAYGLAPPQERWVAPIGCNGGWFNRYHGQTLAILDDFAGKLTGYRLDDVLRLLDRYEVTVPVKGGFANWTPEVIVITTNIHPSRWWDYSERAEQYAALQRRITLVHSWGRDGQRRILGPFSPDWERWWVGPSQRRAVLEGEVRDGLLRPGGLLDWVEHPQPADEYSFIF